MNRDFDKRFKKRSDEFDKDFARMKRQSIFWSFLSLVLSLGLLGFAIWVIVVVLQFFGVI